MIHIQTGTFNSDPNPEGDCGWRPCVLVDYDYVTDIAVVDEDGWRHLAKSKTRKQAQRYCTDAFAHMGSDTGKHIIAALAQREKVTLNGRILK